MELLEKLPVKKGRFLNFLSLLMTAGSPLMKNAPTTLAKSVLTPLELAAASLTDAAIQKKIYKSGTTALIISNEEMENLVTLLKNRDYL